MPRKQIQEIPIDGTNYFMTHDALCWTLYCSEKKTKRVIGHFSRLSHLIDHMFTDLVNSSEATTLSDLQKDILQAEHAVVEAANRLQGRLDELTKDQPTVIEDDGEDDDDFIDDELGFPAEDDDE